MISLSKNQNVLMALASCTRQLVNEEKSPDIIFTSLSCKVDNWAEDETLRVHATPLLHLAKAKQIAYGPVTAELLATAIHETAVSFSSVSEETEKKLYDWLSLKLKGFIGNNDQSSGTQRIFQGPESLEFVRQNRRKTLRTVLRDTVHDVSGIIMAIMSDLEYLKTTIQRSNFFLGVELTHRENLQHQLETASFNTDAISKSLSRIRKEESLDKIREFLRPKEGEISQISYALENILNAIHMAESIFDEVKILANSPISEILKGQKTTTELAKRFFEKIRLVGEKSEKSEAVLIDLRTLLDPEMLRVIAGRNVEVTVDVDKNCSKILGAEDEVLQIILNLIGNARRAMKNTGQLIISAKNVDLAFGHPVVSKQTLFRPDFKRGSFVALEIQDNGPGIPEEIFQNLFRWGNSGSGSTGTGLFVLLQIVERMGGFVVARTSTDARDHGSSFTIYFHRAE